MFFSEDCKYQFTLNASKQFGIILNLYFIPIHVPIKTYLLVINNEYFYSKSRFDSEMYFRVFIKKVVA